MLAPFLDGSYFGNVVALILELSLLRFVSKALRLGCICDIGGMVDLWLQAADGVDNTLSKLTQQDSEDSSAPLVRSRSVACSSGMWDDLILTSKVSVLDLASPKEP